MRKKKTRMMRKKKRDDEKIAKDSGDVDKEEEDEDNFVEKEMEGTYVGTVARELQSNIEVRNKTTAASDLLSTSTLLIQRNVMVITLIVMKMVTTMYK